MKIDILIPTYNRVESLLQNLDHLLSLLKEEEVEQCYHIVVSDNASTDATEQSVRQFVSDRNCQDLITYNRNDENIGLERNAVKVASLSTSTYVIWCGDDDYVAPGYLRFVVEKLNENPLLGCIIPGIANLNEDGSIEEGRLESFEHKFLQKGYQTTYHYSHLAHQMSGIVLRSEELLENYLAQEEYRNPYLFIYFCANRLMQFDGLYAPGFKTKVTVYNEKDWGYNDVGLLDEVFKSYQALGHLFSSRQMDGILLHFAVMHSYRLAFRPLKIGVLIKQYLHLVSLQGCTVRYKMLLSYFFVKEIASAKLRYGKSR